MVISLGTIFPADILALIISASCELDLVRSARSKSPAERCAQPRFLERSSHCVPLPAPGPPRTNTTRTGSSVEVMMLVDFLDLDDALFWR